MYKDGLDSVAIISIISSIKHLQASFQYKPTRSSLPKQKKEQIIIMQFSKITISAIFFALSTMAIATPTPNPLEARMNDLEARTEKLAARAGWTCAFGGDKACQVKVCR
jgi:hypothetical protein